MDGLDLAQTIALVLTSLALVLTVWQTLRADRVTQLDRYHAINQHYTDFVKLCLEHPELGIDDLDEFDSSHPLDARERGQMVAAELLLCMWEHAFDCWKAGLLGPGQWEAWDRWIRFYVGIKLTREHWAYLIPDFGPEFVAYMSEVVAVEAQPALPSLTSSSAP